MKNNQRRLMLDILIFGFILPVIYIFIGISRNDKSILFAGIIGVFVVGVVILAIKKTGGDNNK